MHRHTYPDSPSPSSSDDDDSSSGLEYQPFYLPAKEKEAEVSLSDRDEKKKQSVDESSDNEKSEDFWLHASQTAKEVEERKTNMTTSNPISCSDEVIESTKAPAVPPAKRRVVKKKTLKKRKGQSYASKKKKAAQARKRKEMMQSALERKGNLNREKIPAVKATPKRRGNDASEMLEVEKSSDLVKWKRRTRANCKIIEQGTKSLKSDSGGEIATGDQDEQINFNVRVVEFNLSLGRGVVGLSEKTALDKRSFGFEAGYTAESVLETVYIITATTRAKKRYFRVKWKEMAQTEWVSENVARAHFPILVIQFYEEEREQK